VSADPYGLQVRALFADPKHAGCLHDAVTVRLADSEVRLRLWATAAAGRIDALRFRAWGCPHLIAACEAFCAACEGRDTADLLEFRASDLMQTLSVPVEKTGRILVLEDAVRALGTSLRDAANLD